MFYLSLTDSENDAIAFSSDDELMEALAGVENGIFNFFYQR